MSQQFTIQSEALRDKLNSLLPSQNLGAIGVELTGSTQVIPIVDLTEVAEGSALRQDLQTSLGLNNTTFNLITAATTTLVNTTGFYRVIGTITFQIENNNQDAAFEVTDGVTTTSIWRANFKTQSSARDSGIDSYDFVVKLEAGHSLQVRSSSNGIRLGGSTRQIADISGNLTAP
jgi:hypothetical protein